MKRKKIEIKKIASTTARQVTFSKRKKGLFKKAYELSTLCDAEIALVIFSNTGKLFQYSNSRISEVIARRNMASSDGHHRIQNLEDLTTPPCQTESQGSEHLLLCNELIKNVREIRYMRGEDLQDLRVEELQKLEITITNALRRVLESKLQKIKEENASLKQLVSNVVPNGVPYSSASGSRESDLKSSYSFLQLGLPILDS